MSTGRLERAATVLAPSVDSGAPNERTNLAGAGSQGAGPFPEGVYHTIWANTDSRVRWSGSAPTATTSDMFLPAGAGYSWVPDANSTHVAAIEAGGGTTDALVWRSGP